MFMRLRNSGVLDAPPDALKAHIWQHHVTDWLMVAVAVYEVEFAAESMLSR